MQIFASLSAAGIGVTSEERVVLAPLDSRIKRLELLLSSVVHLLVERIRNLECAVRWWPPGCWLSPSWYLCPLPLCLLCEFSRFTREAIFFNFCGVADAYLLNCVRLLWPVYSMQSAASYSFFIQCAIDRRNECVLMFLNCCNPMSSTSFFTVFCTYRHGVNMRFKDGQLSELQYPKRTLFFFVFGVSEVA